MTIYKEIDDVNEFDFWGGAKDTVDILTDNELEIIFSKLEKTNYKGMSETEFNNFFWFETDTIAKWLGWDNFEILYKARSEDKWFDTQEEYEEYLESKENVEDD